MVLLQIAEPGAPNEVQGERQIGVGIDLGTTNSLIAHFDGTDVRVLKDESGQASLPSVVYYGAKGTVVGAAARRTPVQNPLTPLPQPSECWDAPVPSLRTILT